MPSAPTVFTEPGLSYHSCFLTAWPFKVSTLKLFVLAGMMKNAMTVTSLWLTCEKQAGIRVTVKRKASHTYTDVSIWYGKVAKLIDYSVIKLL